MSSFDKSYAVTDKKAKNQFAAEVQVCACCWMPVNPFFSRRLTTHHLIKQGRSDERCNFLRLCWRPCHQLAEGERIFDDDSGLYLAKLTLGMCLWLKRESDPEYFDLERLTQLYHKNLPDLEEPPAALMERRNKHRRFA